MMSTLTSAVTTAIGLGVIWHICTAISQIVKLRQAPEADGVGESQPARAASAAAGR